MTRPARSFLGRLSGLGALLFCLFALTGCINVEEELTIGRNGSVYYNGHITLGMTKMIEGFAGGGLFGGGGAGAPEAMPMNPLGGLDEATLRRELKAALKPYKALEKKIKGLSGVDMNVWNDRGVIHIASAAQCKTMQVCLKYLAQAKKLDALATGQGGPPFDAMFPRATFALKGRAFSFRLPVKEIQKKWQEQMKNNPLLGGMGTEGSKGVGEAPATAVAPDPSDTAPVLPPPDKGDPPREPDMGNPFDLFGGEGGMQGMMVMMFGASHYRLRVNLPSPPKKTDSRFSPNPHSVVWEIPLSDLFFTKEKKPKDFTGKVRY